MPSLPFATDERRLQDEEHLRLLVLLHYAMAAISLVPLLFFSLFFSLFSSVFLGLQQQSGGAAPFGVFRVLHALAILILAAQVVLNILSARSIQARRRRLLSLVTGGMNCLQFPLGTVLAIFTHIILTRISVVRLYRD